MQSKYKTQNYHSEGILKQILHYKFQIQLQFKLPIENYITNYIAN